MFTDPAHLKISDPGQVEGNVVFTYLDIFHPDKEEVESLKAHYRRGGLGDMTIKNILNNSIQDLLKEIREKRGTIKQKDVQEILYNGTAKASKQAKQTMEEVREAIGVKYF
jgi:tryptophanyl-tRNA synthetase